MSPSAPSAPSGSGAPRDGSSSGGGSPSGQRPSAQNRRDSGGPYGNGRLWPSGTGSSDGGTSSRDRSSGSGTRGSGGPYGNGRMSPSHPGSSDDAGSSSGPSGDGSDSEAPVPAFMLGRAGIPGTPTPVTEGDREQLRKWQESKESDSDDSNGGNVGDLFSGAIHEFSFGAVDLGGDKDSDAYNTGKVLSYVPWNPASALKSGATGLAKVGGRAIVKKEAEKVAGKGAEKAAARGTERAAGDGARGAARKGGGAGGRPPKRTPGVPSGMPAKRWNAANGPGPLGPGVAKTFRGASYTERTIDRDTMMYRAYSDPAKRRGIYWTRDEPRGPFQSMLDSALDPQWGNFATRVAKVRVPAGTRIYEGYTGPQRGLVGGGDQVVLRNVPRAWMVK